MWRNSQFLDREKYMILCPYFEAHDFGKNNFLPKLVYKVTSPTLVNSQEWSLTIPTNKQKRQVFSYLYKLVGIRNVYNFVNLTLSMVRSRLNEVEYFQSHWFANHLASNSYKSGVFFRAIREIILSRTLFTFGSSVCIKHTVFESISAFKLSYDIEMLKRKGLTEGIARLTHYTKRYVHEMWFM